MPSALSIECFIIKIICEHVVSCSQEGSSPRSLLLSYLVSADDLSTADTHTIGSYLTLYIVKVATDQA